LEKSSSFFFFFSVYEVKIRLYKALLIDGDCKSVGMAVLIAGDYKFVRMAVLMAGDYKSPEHKEVGTFFNAGFQIRRDA